MYYVRGPQPLLELCTGTGTPRASCVHHNTGMGMGMDGDGVSFVIVIVIDGGATLSSPFLRLLACLPVSSLIILLPFSRRRRRRHVHSFTVPSHRSLPPFHRSRCVSFSLRVWIFAANPGYSVSQCSSVSWCIWRVTTHKRYAPVYLCTYVRLVSSRLVPVSVSVPVSVPVSLSRFPFPSFSLLSFSMSFAFRPHPRPHPVPVRPLRIHTWHDR